MLGENDKRFWNDEEKELVQTDKRCVSLFKG